MVCRGVVRLYLIGTLQAEAGGESDRLGDCLGGERVGRKVGRWTQLVCGCSQRPLQVVGSDCLWDAGCGGLLDMR